jgi:molybdopterin converting factor small subunit
MKVIVKIGGLLRLATGELHVELDLPEQASAADALAQLFGAHPGLAAELPAGGKTLSGLPYHFFVNRRLVGEAQMATRRLRDGDTLHILSPTAGG